MKLEELLQSIEQDMKFDKTQLDKESLDIPSLFHKYYKILLMEKAWKRKLTTDYDTLYKDKWEYYLGKAEPEAYRDKPFGNKVLKSDLEVYLNSDKVLISYKEKLELQQEKIKYLEQILNVINNRSFQIKNAIDFVKWTSGGA